MHRAKTMAADQAKKLRIANFGLRIWERVTKTLIFIVCFLNFEIRNAKFEIASSDQPIRPGEHLRRNRQTDLLCGLEIDRRTRTSSAAPLASQPAWRPSRFCRRR